MAILIAAAHGFERRHDLRVNDEVGTLGITRRLGDDEVGSVLVLELLRRAPLGAAFGYTLLARATADLDLAGFGVATRKDTGADGHLGLDLVATA